MNVHGLNSPFKRNSMWKEMDKLKGDVLCAQETHFMTTKQPKCSYKAFPNVFSATEPVKKWGALIAVKHSIAFKLHEVICDS